MVQKNNSYHYAERVLFNTVIVNINCVIIFVLQNLLQSKFQIITHSRFVSFVCSLSNDDVLHFYYYFTS